MLEKIFSLIKGGPLNGWKTIVGYIAANVLAGSPLALEALNKYLADPSLANLASLAANLLLFYGVGHQLIKKV